jgi:hypothetical protein
LVSADSAFRRPLALWVAGLFFVCIIAGVFAPGLSGGFLFDDYPTILQEPKVQLEQLSWAGLREASLAFHPEGGFPRPIAGFTLGLNHALGNGLEPFAYKLTNLAFHVANALLLFAWLMTLLSTPSWRSHRPALAAAAITLLWAIHPLQVSTVLYVIQRMEMLWVTFALLALWQYTEGRLRQIRGEAGARKHFAIAGAAIPLGLMAKESAALIPFFLVALECVVFRFEAIDPRWTKAWRTLSLLGVALGSTVYAALNLRYLRDPAAYASRDFDAMGRLLAQLEIVPGYLVAIVWPRIDRMTFYYDQLAAPTGITLPVALGGLSMLAMMLAALWLRHRKPAFAFGVLLFLLGHLLTSSAIPLELAFEHRNYLPLAGVVLAVYGLLPERLLQPGRSAGWMMVAVAALALGSLTVARSATWGNTVLLAHTLAEINPQSIRASMDLGEQYMLAAKKDPTSPWYAKAVAEFERASQLPQGSIMGEHGLLLMNGDFGLAADPAWWPRVQEKIATVPLRPQEVDAITGMVEQRLAGLPLDGASLANVALTLAKRRALAPELYALYGTQAYQDLGVTGPAAELFAMALTSPTLDEDFRARIRRGIVNLGGDTLLKATDASIAKDNRGQH